MAPCGFTKALEMLFESRVPMRRLQWAEKSKIVYIPSFDQLIDDEGSTYSPNRDDYSACDWVEATP